MGVCMQAKRTLVKSPPELWAELSDSAALARHLGELGEVRIVRTEPERSVEWEAAQISGTVLIEPSGWGTKVTLTATRTLVPGSDPESNAPEIVPEPAPIPEPAPEPTAALEPEPVEVMGPERAPALEPEAIEAIEPDPMAEVQPEALEIMPMAEVQPEALEIMPMAEPEPMPEPEPEPEPGAIEIVSEPEVVSEPRLGFFARLFRRRRPQREHEPAAELDATEKLVPVAVDQLPPQEPMQDQPALVQPEREDAVEDPAYVRPAADEPELEEQPMPDAPPPNLELAIELVAAAPDGPATEAGGQAPIGVAEPPDISAELAEAEQLAAAQEVVAEDVTAVLTSVLDRLGAAHHRPFSRA